MELHIGDTVIAFPLAISRAQELQHSVQTLLQTFAEKQKQERPKRYKSMDYRFAGAFPAILTGNSKPGQS